MSAGERRVWPRLRWWIGGLLFASTVINYIDRQALSLLAPVLKHDYRWSNEDFALVLAAFRLAYAAGQALSGRMIDRLGVRRGLSLSVAFYSLAAALTSLASGLRSFCAFRFLLGAGESANWPGATKAVAEWFPERERSWAVALFDSGSSAGGAIAPFLVFWLYRVAGGWRPVFLITGTLGALWLLAWRALYRSPETHPRLGEGERAMILSGRTEAEEEGARPSWLKLLAMKETWGIVLGRSLTDPVWFFVTDWFPLYLASRGFAVEHSLMAVWAPFAAADLGNFFGGGLSSRLIARGWPVLRSRKALMIGCGIGMSSLALTAYVTSLPALAGLFALSTFAYSAWSTMDIVLPADLYPRHSVATVAGMSGTGAGLMTIVSSLAIGRVTDRYSFGPVIAGASLVPLVATALVLVLVRRRR